MHSSKPNPLALLVVRRTLGISAFLYAFYVVAHYAWELAFPTPGDLLAILVVVLAGVCLGVAFGKVWPLPPDVGRERIVRTVMLTIPALGIGIAIQVFLEGAQSDRAYYVIFALAAWLGSTLIQADEAESDAEPKATAATDE